MQKILRIIFLIILPFVVLFFIGQMYIGSGITAEQMGYNLSQLLFAGLAAWGWWKVYKPGKKTPPTK